MRRPIQILIVILLAGMALSACKDRVGQEMRNHIGRAIIEAMAETDTYIDAVSEALQPVALLSSQEVATLRQYLNPEQLEQARALGIPRADGAADIEALVAQDALVPLPDSTAYWIVRELTYSVPYATPDLKAMLTELGRRFQARLDSLGLPPLRFEITSVLRTAEHQAALREVNVNAAGGVSTHEFGTTVDISYTDFALPKGPVLDFDVGEASWLQPHLRRASRLMLEDVLAERAGELQAILGQVLQEMQAEGKVMVTMERRQTVYHMTVAQAY